MNIFSERGFLIFLSATVYSCYDLNSRRSGTLRVKNGRDVSPGQFTYVLRIELVIPPQKNASVVQEYYQICTGSALTPTATLTAVHCYQENLQISGIAKYVVRYGSAPDKPLDDHLDQFSDVLNISKPPVAWGMNHPFFVNDLAIWTTEPIQLKSYGKISTLDYPSLFGLHVTLMGYGVTNHSKLDTDTKTLKLPLQVTDGMMINCEEFYDSTFPFLCTKSACGNPQGILGPGDSGGPVVHSTGIVGINSMSFFESYKDHPDYRRVPLPSQVLVMPLSPYIDWITMILQQNSNS